MDKRRWQNILAGVVMVMVFITYWCNITLFCHQHVINGIALVHSHPYKAQHQHSESQILTIHFLSQMQIDGAPQSVSVPEFFPLYQTEDAICLSKSLPVDYMGYMFLLRAPPVFYL